MIGRRVTRNNQISFRESFVALTKKISDKGATEDIQTLMRGSATMFYKISLVFMFWQCSVVHLVQLSHTSSAIYFPSTTKDYLSKGHPDRRNNPSE